MSLKHNTIYPKRYIVTTGDLIQGFLFYGPFDTYPRVQSWLLDNLHADTPFNIVELFDVRDG